MIKSIESLRRYFHDEGIKVIIYGDHYGLSIHFSDYHFLLRYNSEGKLISPHIEEIVGIKK